MRHGYGEHDDHHHGRHRGGGRHGRAFNYGELRLLVLAMIAERPRHGYELIKAIEERMGGSYTPSPGVIYPTLAWLVDMGFVTAEADPSGRKHHSLAPEGKAFLQANRAAADELLARPAPAGPGAADPVPAPVVRAIENLKLAVRLRVRRGPIGDAAAADIATALDAAARAVERS